MTMVCRVCAGAMVPGLAIETTLTGEPEWPGAEIVTLSPNGPGRLVPCMKCLQCGHSVTIAGQDGQGAPAESRHQQEQGKGRA